MTLRLLNDIVQKLEDRRIHAISFIFQDISALIFIEHFTEYGGNPEDIQRKTRFPTKVGLFKLFTTDINPVFAPMSDCHYITTLSDISYKHFLERKIAIGKLHCLVSLPEGDENSGNWRRDERKHLCVSRQSQ
jgi:hypothetical protein